ncbi:hypothetical protein Dsin_005170 [Dipteronia sinensis]|uniref:Reverse transcriptase n=1 Tax=Dipteronia sinensis TaxID=43782 RepID=A0AAE0EED1_9ROSI|nr:hypothetical protein Dsin_005170 [Dipteronia sinensis]
MHHKRVTHAIVTISTVDSMVFTKASEKDCHTIKSILNCYASASGQLVNFDKSAMCVSKRVPRSHAKSLARILGVQLVGCHERYLGLPSFAGKCKRDLFFGIRNRVWERIKGLSKSLVNDLHKLCGRFLWGSNEQKCKFIGALSDGLPFLDFILDCKNQLKREEFEILCMALWSIWFRQNGRVHDSTEINVEDIRSWAEVFIADYHSPNVVERGDSVVSCSIVSSWKPPNFVSLKVNTDVVLDLHNR